jgi:tetratricopeptide (TPR) repeat protein
VRHLILCGCLGCLGYLALAGCGGAGNPAPKSLPLPPLVADRPPTAETASVAPDEPLVVEAVSLFGEALYRTSLPAEVRTDREARLAEAQAAVDASPNEPAADALLRLGRSLADLERYRDAIEVFGRGVARFPEDPRFLRHRGHRYITIRRFDLAIADLEKAVRLIQGRPDEPEPGALPAAQAEPAFTLHGTIWYHLGLARYLSGDFAGAADAFRESLARAHQPDSQVASSQWLYMSLRRLGRDVSDVSDVSETEARRLLDPITNDMAVLENRPYHWLLLMEKGEMPPESLLGFVGQDDLDPSTLGYGVGAWYLAAGKEEEAVRLFRLVLSRGQWMAFGHIAAEAELKRMGVAPRVGG